ncbi:MAG: ankyrin repeat domain-containing protein [Cyanobacteria bacterium P01_F01_bin.53]
MKKIMEWFGLIIAANAVFIFVVGIVNILFELDLAVEDIALPYDFGELAMMCGALLVVGGLFWLFGNLGRLFKGMGKHPVKSIAITAPLIAALVIFGNYGLTFAMGGPVQRAVEMGNTQQLEKLLTTNTYRPDELNEPLYFALKQSNYDMAQALVTAGADVDYIDDDEFASPLLLSSVFHWEKEAITFLLDQGANANAQDNLGRTALIVATTYRANSFSTDDAVSVLEQLHSAGADASITTNDGKTALDIATANKNQPLLDQLATFTAPSK